MRYQGGIGAQAIDTVKGMGEFQSAQIDCFAGGDCHKQVAMSTTIVTEPTTVVHTTIDPVRNDWEEGNRARGAGRVAFLLGEAIAAKGLTKLGTTTVTKAPAVGDELLRPGPWAKESVPSSGPGRITQAERTQLNPIGDQYGCHSCGATSPGTKSGNWIGDHQPVSRTVPPDTRQVLYPYCQACSNAQGLWIINLIRQGLL